MSGPDPAESAVFALPCARAGDRVRIVAIEGGWGVRQRLQQIGLHPGERLVVKRSAALGGPQLIDVNGTDVAMGRGMAKHVMVEPDP